MSELEPGCRVRTALGYEGELTGYDEFGYLPAGRNQLARVVLDGDSHGTYYRPHLLTRIGDTNDDRDDDRDTEPAGDAHPDPC